MTLLTQRVTMNWSGDGGPAVAGSITATGDEVFAFEQILGNASNQRITQAIRKDGVNLIYLKSDIDATVDFVDGSNTTVLVGDPIELVAGVPWMWAASSGVDNPLSADAAKISVDSLAVGLLKGRGIQDATP